MRYPDDPRARALVQEYLDGFQGDLMGWVLTAENLDFRSAVLDGLNLQGAPRCTAPTSTACRCGAPTSPGPAVHYSPPVSR